MLKAFNKQIYKYGLIVALLCELLSLLILGWSPKFAYGLALGTCIAIVNYNILLFSAQGIIRGGRGILLSVLGYAIRLAVYGGAFYVSYMAGTESGIATLLGFVTLKTGMVYAYGFKPKFSENSVGGKKLNDLDNDCWSEQKSNKDGRIRKVFRFMEWPADEGSDSNNSNSSDDNR